MHELELHINLLHEYNDIKDIAQTLLGRLGKNRTEAPSQITTPAHYLGVKYRAFADFELMKSTHMYTQK